MSSEKSARIYVPWALKFYDFWVLLVSNNWAWRCPTKSVLAPFYQRHLEGSEYHLDVGAGTGYYPAKQLDPANKSSVGVKGITLLDINSHTLDAGSSRIKGVGYRGQVDTVNHNVFQPFDEGSELRRKFDSIALFYVLHCLPGKFPEKAESVARNLADGLAEDGLFYGSTILSVSRRGKEPLYHNWFGRMLMNVYNNKGVFGNAQDEEEGLREGLEAVFEEVDIEVVGMVALFVCRRPRK